MDYNCGYNDGCMLKEISTWEMWYPCLHPVDNVQLHPWVDIDR